MEIINQELIDFFKFLTDHRIFLDFDERREEIVPDILEHSRLLKKFNIHESILKVYFIPTKYLLSEDQLQELLSYTYAENQEFIQHPYNVAVLGAFVLRNSLIWKLQSVLGGREFSRARVNGKIPQYFEDLKPYFVEYAKGFKLGFDNFEGDEVKPFLTLFADKQDYCKKVFDFVILPKSDLYNFKWGDGLGFGMSQDREIKGGFEDGKREGYFYRAWSIILSNSDSFASLFQRLEENIAPGLNSDSLAESQQEIQSLANIICHKNSTEIVGKIKIQYRNIQGKRLKLLLIALQGLGLIPKERTAKKFHTLCKNEFDWDIASYTAMNDYSYNPIIDLSELEEMTDFIKDLIEE